MRTTVIYMFDGTFEGLLCCVFDAFEKKQNPLIFSEKQAYQHRLDEIIYHINTSSYKFERVLSGIKKKMGVQCYEDIWTAFLNTDPNAPNIIFNYLVVGFNEKHDVRRLLSNDDVIAFNTTLKAVTHETMRMIEFVRFSELSSGVFFAKIAPQNNCIPTIMQHFVDRFSIQPFIIYDERHHTAGIYDLSGWYIEEDVSMPTINYSENEQEYKSMWKRFYDTIAIKERVSYKRMRAMMPKKYWSNLIELQK